MIFVTAKPLTNGKYASEQLISRNINLAYESMRRKCYSRDGMVFRVL